MKHPETKKSGKLMRSLLWMVPTITLIILSSCHKPEAPKAVAVPAPAVVETPPPPPLQKFEGLPQAPQKNCANAKEYEALNTRALQTELTLVALSCGEHKEYGQFIQLYQSDLTLQAKQLRAYFVRNFKKQADYRLDQFVTRLANTYAKQIQVNKSNGFCREGSELFKEMTAKPLPPLTNFSYREPFTTVHGVSPCK